MSESATTLLDAMESRLRGEFAAQQLECSAETVPQRVREAKRRIAAALAQDEAPRADRSCAHG